MQSRCTAQTHVIESAANSKANAVIVCSFRCAVECIWIVSYTMQPLLLQHVTVVPSWIGVMHFCLQSPQTGASVVRRRWCVYPCFKSRMPVSIGEHPPVRHYYHLSIEILGHPTTQRLQSVAFGTFNIIIIIFFEQTRPCQLLRHSDCMCLNGDIFCVCVLVSGFPLPCGDGTRDRERIHHQTRCEVTASHAHVA